MLLEEKNQRNSTSCQSSELPSLGLMRDQIHSRTRAKSLLWASYPAGEEKDKAAISLKSP